MVKSNLIELYTTNSCVHLWKNRLTVITHFLCKKGISINNNNKHKAINADINRYYRRIQLLKLKK